MDIKRCTKCAVGKTYKEFSPDRRRKDGLQSWCKACSNAANLKRYRDNPKVRADKKVYDVEYVNKNRDRKNLNNSIWSGNNRSAVREMGRRWKKSNRHKVASYVRKRQAAKLQRTPSWLNENQLREIESYYWLAADLRAVSGQTYHVDHIIPLQGKGICGLHVPWNLQVLPSDINERKLNKYGRYSASALPIPSVR
jgi:hypothetical protein